MVFAGLLQLFDEFLDVAGDLVTPSDEEGIVRIDDDQVLDSDGGYEAVFTLDKEVLAPQVNVFPVDHRVGA